MQFLLEVEWIKEVKKGSSYLIDGSFNKLDIKQRDGLIITSKCKKGGKIIADKPRLI